MRTSVVRGGLLALANFHARFVRRGLSPMRDLAADDRGTAAIEFAFISVPFFMLVFGIFKVCLLFFTTFSLENAVWQASREMRTGQFQSGSGAYAGLDGEALRTAFKQSVCNMAPPFVSCTDIRVLAQSVSQFSEIVAPNCRSDTNTIIDEETARGNFSVGGSSVVILMTACLRWAMGPQIPFLDLGDLADGTTLIQVSAAFRTEPFGT
jgi:Flp pilus assembly protein TadG